MVWKDPELRLTNLQVQTTLTNHEVPRRFPLNTYNSLVRIAPQAPAELSRLEMSAAHLRQLLLQNHHWLVKTILYYSKRPSFWPKISNNTSRCNSHSRLLSESGPQATASQNLRNSIKSFKWSSKPLWECAKVLQISNRRKIILAHRNNLHLASSCQVAKESPLWKDLRRLVVLLCLSSHRVQVRAPRPAHHSHLIQESSRSCTRK